MITPGLGVNGFWMMPGAGLGPAVGLTGHCGTWQHVGSFGSGTNVHSDGTLSYREHLERRKYSHNTCIIV